MAVVKLLLRFVLIAGILAYFVAAAGLLATRYWVMPRIDQWRPEIQKAISEAVGTPVRFDSITADWRGLNPGFQIVNLTILDAGGVAQLGVPTTDAILSWRSLLEMQPVFRYVGVSDVALVTRRDPEGELHVAGFELDPDAGQTTSPWQSATVRWLLKQGRINITNARLVWVDQKRNALPLVLQDIDLTLDNGLLGHKLELKASLPPQWGGKLEAVASVGSVQSSISRLLLDKPDGYLYATVSEIYPQAVRPWLDVPGIHGSFSGRVWLDLMNGKLTNFTVNLAGRDASFKPAETEDGLFTIGQFSWRASGPLSLLGAGIEFPEYVETDKPLQLLSASLSLEDSVFRAPASGMQPVQVDQFSADFSVSRPTREGFRINVQDVAFSNPDGLVTARGSWTLGQEGKGGRLDLQGTLARFKLPQLHHYLPDTIGEEAHAWLASGFTSGLVPRASFEVAGMVDDFPFAGGQGGGTFRVDGNIQDWGVDYAPVTSADELPWPPLSGLNGTLSLLNDRIAVDISTGSLALPKGKRISLSALSAVLVDLEGNPELTVKAQTSAEAEDYLGLLKDTALRDVAPEFVRNFAGKGSWTMPLELRVPINELEKTSFRGELGFNGGTVTYAASLPLTEIGGAAILTETGFESQGLSGKFLGGPIELTGGINATLDTIKGKGQLAWPELAKLADSELLGSWLKGKLGYEFAATVKDGKFDVSVSSDLRGTQIDMPAPMGLTSGQAAQTRLTMQGFIDDKKPHVWTLTVADRLALNATSVRADQAQYPSFFINTSIGLASAKPPGGNGLTLAGQLPVIKVDEWMPVIDALSKELSSPPTKGPALFPPLALARLQAKQVVMGANELEDVSAELSVKNGRQYVVNLTSAQTNGSVQWALDQGKLQDGFHVRLDRLEIGNHEVDQSQAAKKVSAQKAPERPRSALPEPGTLSSLPALDLEIKDLTLYGARLGELRLAGRNTADKKQWQISRMQIINPGAELNATGSCRFDSDPGVTLAVELKMSDMGEMIQHMGYGDRARKGRGTMTANVQWQRFPWEYDYSGLSGKAELKLEEGVFDHVNSNAARVLELLSLQSLNRILSANINPQESFREGFPWSSITASFEINQGVVDTQNATVTSPVATISMSGKSSLVSETWDLEAVVRPNLDMSGTALATGFLINPIVGLSALVGQYILRNPVEAALSQRYRVVGPWQDPKIEPAGSATTEPATPSTPAAPARPAGR